MVEGNSAVVHYKWLFLCKLADQLAACHLDHNVPNCSRAVYDRLAMTNNNLAHYNDHNHCHDRAVDVRNVVDHIQMVVDGIYPLEKKKQLK